MLQQFNEDLSEYTRNIQERQAKRKSTTRRDFYRDILMELDEGTRVRAVAAILEELQAVDGNAGQIADVRILLGAGTIAPSAVIPAEAWNADRLNQQLLLIDSAIASGDYERAVTVSYTSLEGFLEAFIRAKEQRESYPNEIIALSREVKIYLKNATNAC